MPDLLTFVLSDYRCPHCGCSLRFRWVRRKEIPITPWKNGTLTTSYEICPACNGKIKSAAHPAVIDDGLWARWLIPGIVIWVAAMMMHFQPVMMMVGTFALLMGCVALVYYMVAARWRRPYYVKFEGPEESPNESN